MLNMELIIDKPENWDAHKKRDFITDFMLFMSENNQKILKEAVLSDNGKNNPNLNVLKELSNSNEIERLFRVSFPTDIKTLSVTINPVYPIESFKEAIVKEEKVRTELESFWLIRLIDWIAKKSVGKEAFEEIQKDVKKDINDKSLEKLKQSWGSMLALPLIRHISLFLSNNGFKNYKVAINFPDKRIVVPLSDSFADINSMKF